MQVHLREVAFKEELAVPCLFLPPEGSLGKATACPGFPLRC